MSAPEIGGIIGERRDGVSDQGWWESRAAELMAERDALRAERDASLAGEVRIAQRLRAAKQRIARLQEALREVADHDEHRTDYECVIFMQETARNALSQDTESPPEVNTSAERRSISPENEPPTLAESPEEPA